MVRVVVAVFDDVGYNLLNGQVDPEDRLVWYGMLIQEAIDRGRQRRQGSQRIPDGLTERVAHGATVTLSLTYS